LPKEERKSRLAPASKNFLDLDESSCSSKEVSEEGESVASPPIKRTMSLPKIKFLNAKELPKIEEEEEKPGQSGGKNSEEDLLNSSPSLSSGTKKKTPLKIKRLKSEDVKESKFKDSPYDEDFFYYFETYLLEAIRKINKANEKQNMGRSRSKSEAY
jgi:hypothetical protein